MIRLLTFLLLAVLGGHGLWLLNDVVPNEDLIFDTQLTNGQLSAIWSNVSWSNAHFQFIPYYLLTLGPTVVGTARFLSLCCLTAIAFASFVIATKSGLWTRSEALWASAMAILWPGYMLYFAITPFPYAFYLAVFLSGVALLLYAEECTERRRPWVRFLACIFVTLSFSVNSFLLFFYAFLPIHFGIFLQKTGSPIGQGLYRYGLKRFEWIVLPLIYWAVKQAYAWTHPLKGGYNAFVLSWDLAVFNAGSFAKAIVAATLPNDRFEGIVMFSAFAFAWLAFLLRSRGAVEPGKQMVRLTTAAWRLLWPVLLLGAAVLPYVLVGKSPGVNVGNIDNAHWYTRHLLLAGLPVALIVVSLCSVLRGVGGSGERLVNSLLMAFVVLFVADRARHCVRYQLIGIQDKGMVEMLRSSPIAAKAHVMGIASAVEGFSYSVKPNYVWPFFLQRAFGGPLDRYVFEEPPGMPLDWYRQNRISPESMNAFSAALELGDGGISGYRPPPDMQAQASMIVTDGITKSHHPWSDVAAYWWHRWHQPDQRPALMDRAVQVQIVSKQAQ
jgi:hypothetical protein